MHDAEEGLKRHVDLGCFGPIHGDLDPPSFGEQKPDVANASTPFHVEDVYMIGFRSSLWDGGRVGPPGFELHRQLDHRHGRVLYN